MTIGERIRYRRIELGLSVEELADKLGKDRATVYRYESDEIKNMPITIIKPLAIALDVDPAWLVGWRDSEDDEITTIAAHKDNIREAWTEEELQSIEDFKEFVKSKRKQK